MVKFLKSKKLNLEIFLGHREVFRADKRHSRALKKVAFFQKDFLIDSIKSLLKIYKNTKLLDPLPILNCDSRISRS